MAQRQRIRSKTTTHALSLTPRAQSIKISQPISRSPSLCGKRSGISPLTVVPHVPDQSAAAPEEMYWLGCNAAILELTPGKASSNTSE